MSHAFRQWFGLLRAKSSRRTVSLSLRVEPLELRCLPTVFLVTNTDDAGAGSLRQAMLDAESTPNAGVVPDEIHFNIPGDGVHTIFPTTTLGLSQRSLPEILDPVIIDGYTQPGASPNTLAVGDDAVLKIEINGSNLTGTKQLFIVSGDNSTVRGLAITHVHDAAFTLGGFGPFIPNHTTIVGNFLGTDAGGSTFQGDDGPAIKIITANNTVIGGLAPADRNVIAPGGFVPTATINMQSGTGNVIQGNYIGVNKDGSASLQSPNGGFAIDIGFDSGSNTIAGNVIVATLTGIRLTQGNTGNNLVQGNFIGTNATGTAGLAGGQFGIDVQSSGDIIKGNVISGFSNAISINHQGAPGPGPTIQGNKIGTDITGTLAIPNSSDGIFILSSPGGATIGGTNPGDGNTIANSGGYGISVNSGTECSILGNSIFANGKLGINLNGALDGFFGPVTANDAGDGDTGPNGLQNYPVITSASTGAADTNISGTINSTPNTTFRIEFFANDVADASGFGQGQTLLGFTDVTTDASGDASFNVDFNKAGGSMISATATDPAGNTSEFSQDFTAGSLDVIVDASTTQEFLDSLTVIHGSLILVGVAGRTDLLLPNLTQVDGNFIVTDNADLTTLSVPLLASVGGNVDVSNNPMLTSIDLGGLNSAAGSISISGNAAATGVDLSQLSSVGGGVSISGNTAATGVDLSQLSSVGGGVSISGNTAATGVDLSQLSSVGGGVSISGNTAATGVDLSQLSSVGGDETVQAMNSVTAATADGNTEVTLLTSAAKMTAVLSPGTFDDAVKFTVIRLDPAASTSESGLDSANSPATIDPLAAYHFQFAISTLGQDASLTFEINVLALSNNDHDAFLANLAAGTATVAVKNDAPGSVYQAFAIADQPTDHSITITRLDANGQPLLPGSIDPPANVRFEGITGHFSTFAVVLVSSVNSVPSAVDDTVPMNSARSISINVLGNDSDPDSDPLSVTSVTQPTNGHGTVSINPNGSLQYTQTVYFTGTETFTYGISDGHGGTATGTVTVAVHLPAAVGMGMLSDQILASGLSHKLQGKLLAKINSAEKALAKGKSTAAIHKLTAFAKQVHALQATGTLSQPVADLLLFETQNIESALNSTSEPRGTN